MMSDNRELPEGTTPESERPAGMKDPKDMSLEELEKVLESGEVPEPAEEPAEEPAHEAEQAEADDTEAEQQEAQGEEPDAEEPVEETTEEVESASDEAESEITLQDVMDRLTITEERNSILERKLGRRAGNEGFLKQEIERLKRELAQARSGQAAESEADEFQPEARQAPPQQPQQAQQDPNTAYLLNLAIQNTAAGFYAKHPDVILQGEDGSQSIDPEYQAELTKFEQSGDVQNILLASSVTDAVGVLEDMMATAHSKFKIKKLQATAKERTKKRVDQAEGLKKKKRLASVSSSGSGRATPKKKPLDPMTMPMKDLEKIIASGKVPS
jgi:hypothetical protein